MFFEHRDIKYRASEVTNKGSETSETIVRYQYQRRTHKRRTLQKWDSTNVGPVQTSDWYKRRTSTNVGPVQTLDWYKRRTGTFIRKNVGGKNIFEFSD